MTKFLNTSKAYAEIEDIINKAKTKVVLISPYIQISKLLLDRLKYADKKGIKIVVVCREDDLKADARSDLKQLKNLELRFDNNLHAKCFYNEETMVVGSLNLYDYSQQNNREMGILLSLDDHNVFDEARNEAEFIVKNAEKDGLRNSFGRIVKEAKSLADTIVQDEVKRPTSKSHPNKIKHAGYCIRCGNKISYNPEAPYCPDCYKVWAEWRNPDYMEMMGYCHKCGEPQPASMAKPLCDSCYWSQK